MNDPSFQVSDEEWIKRFRSGDQTAFSMLVKRYMPIVKQETARFRRYGAYADDLAQEALLGLLGAVKGFSFDRATPFSAYARVCIRNRVISAARTFDDTLFVSGEWEEQASCLSDPVDLIAEKEQSKRIFERLQKMLTEREYRVLMLYLSAYSYDEIALLLHISRKSVDNALQRAKHKLLSTPWRGSER